MIVALEGVVVMLGISLMTAGLTLFIQKCFEPEMIFRKWFLLLTWYWIKWWRKKDKWKRPILKPLGLCVYCQMPYISAVVYFLFISYNIPMLFLFIGMCYIWLEIIKKIIK